MKIAFYTLFLRIADCYNRVCQRVFFLYDALEPEISYCRTKDCDIFSALLELFFGGG